MEQEERDKGLINVLLKRFETERLPRMKELQAKVDDGGVLDDTDLSYLQKVLSDAHQVMDVLKRNPEYGALAKGALLMYEDIMAKSQQNAK